MDDPALSLSRRGFISVGVAAASVPGVLSAQEKPLAATGQDTPHVQKISLKINGKNRSLSVDTRLTLLDALRDNLGLTGTKKGCDHGQCGACTVHVDGARRLSCFTLMAGLDGAAVTTIEGSADGDELHPMQQAFIDNDAFQCGYCTPGQIMSAIACVKEDHARTDEEIREYMSGNICRCSAYPNIVAAVKQAAPRIGRG